MKNRDILIDQDYDIRFSGTDLAVGDSTLQNQALLLKCHKGELKEHPYAGVGIDDMVNDCDTDFWRHRIREELRRDGMKVEKITIRGEQVNITAKYQ